jgi:hypothetical protein
MTGEKTLPAPLFWQHPIFSLRALSHTKYPPPVSNPIGSHPEPAAVTPLHHLYHGRPSPPSSPLFTTVSSPSPQICRPCSLHSHLTDLLESTEAPLSLPSTIHPQILTHVVATAFALSSAAGALQTSDVLPRRWGSETQARTRSSSAFESARVWSSGSGDAGAMASKRSRRTVTSDTIHKRQAFARKQPFGLASSYSSHGHRSPLLGVIGAYQRCERDLSGSGPFSQRWIGIGWARPLQIWYALHPSSSPPLLL